MNQSCLGFSFWTTPYTLEQMPVVLLMSLCLFPFVSSFFFFFFSEKKDERNPPVYEGVEKLKESLWNLKYQRLMSFNWENKLQCFTSPDPCL